MEAISVARRREERGEGRAQERWRRNFPPPSPYARVCPYAGEEERRWGREGHRERGRRERERERLGERKKREKEGERRGRARVQERRKSCTDERERERVK